MKTFDCQHQVNALGKFNSLAFCGDCLDVLPQLPEGSIDMVLCDLPYHMTCNSWDSPIPLEDYIVVGDHALTFSELTEALWSPPRKKPWAKGQKDFFKLLSMPMGDITSFWKKNKQPGLWSNYKRLIKHHGVIVLFGAGMFSAELMATGKDLWRYNIIWEKNHPTGFLNANKMPLRSHEDILIFYRKLPVYHPQKSCGHPRKVSTAKHKRNCKMTTNYGTHRLMTYDSTERYPKSVWKFANDKETGAFHPTQKPVALCEELIKTYTNEGAVVLDNCAGSFTTAVACDNLNRQWICIEKEKSYFTLGIARVNRNRAALGLHQIDSSF